MKRVYIKYNPYKVETEVMLEDKELKSLDVIGNGLRVFQKSYLKNATL